MDADARDLPEVGGAAEVSEPEPGQATPVSVPPADGRPDLSKCPECEYRAGPFASTKAASADLLRHLEDRHARMMAHCECGWASGPHRQKFEGLAALVRHAAEAHRVVSRPPGPPKFNEGWARNAIVQMLDRARRFEVDRDGKRIVSPGERPLDPAAELLAIGHEILIGVAACVDLMLEARTGRPSIHPLPSQTAPDGSEK